MQRAPSPALPAAPSRTPRHHCRSPWLLLQDCATRHGGRARVPHLWPTHRTAGSHVPEVRHISYTSIALQIVTLQRRALTPARLKPPAAPHHPWNLGPHLPFHCLSLSPHVLHSPTLLLSRSWIKDSERKKRRKTDREECQVPTPLRLESRDQEQLIVLTSPPLRGIWRRLFPTHKEYKYDPSDKERSKRRNTRPLNRSQGVVTSLEPLQRRPLKCRNTSDF